MKRILFLLAISAAIFAGCNKGDNDNPVPDAPNPNASLIGTTWKGVDNYVLYQYIDGVLTPITHNDMYNFIFDTYSTFTIDVTSTYRYDFEGGNVSSSEISHIIGTYTYSYVAATNVGKLEITYAGHDAPNPGTVKDDTMVLCNADYSQGSLEYKKQ